MLKNSQNSNYDDFDDELAELTDDEVVPNVKIPYNDYCFNLASKGISSKKLLFRFFHLYSLSYAMFFFFLFILRTERKSKFKFSKKSGFSY